MSNSVISWTVALQAPLPMGFSKQEYWSGLPCPPPGGLPAPGIEPASLMSPALTGRFFITSTTWEAASNAEGTAEPVLTEVTSGEDDKEQRTNTRLANSTSSNMEGNAVRDGGLTQRWHFK